MLNEASGILTWRRIWSCLTVSALSLSGQLCVKGFQLQSFDLDYETLKHTMAISHFGVVLSASSTCNRKPKSRTLNV